MSPVTPGAPLPRAHMFTRRLQQQLQRLLHIEALAGVALLLAAALALIWANSSHADSYHALWHTQVTLELGSWRFSQDLHFWVNDILMTLFFLVVGMEIRREIHDGALSDWRSAMLPVCAALSAITLPALIYAALNREPMVLMGWAIPTATDIAFAVGVLALLGRSLPGSLRVFLLALAIIDDLVAILIIAFFYSGGLDYDAFLIAALGVAAVLGLQKMGIGSAWAYVLPGAVLWFGLLKTGAHPTLAGVVLGMMSPVRALPLPRKARHLNLELAQKLERQQDAHEVLHTLRDMQLAQREMLAPVDRIPALLHPWVAFVIMPVFALANAGVSLGGLDLQAPGAQSALLGVAIALIVGKPLGVLLGTWLPVRLGLCSLPPGMDWKGVTLIGLLAGIGFTMSIFVANLAFDQAGLLDAAKLGVLCGSLVSALLGLAWGLALQRRYRRQAALAAA
ncbi:Na+/H+ antiporter NhaA [Alcaligenes sp. WGS1538]|uniref:Na+/H+ antiporter NhaA n=1 Tax=Alcaligenes sp. WGS1538 TaxID=3366811 RepID=UPI00372D1DF4